MCASILFILLFYSFFAPQSCLSSFTPTRRLAGPSNITLGKQPLQFMRSSLEPGGDTHGTMLELLLHIFYFLYVGWRWRRLFLMLLLPLLLLLLVRLMLLPPPTTTTEGQSFPEFPPLVISPLLLLFLVLACRGQKLLVLVVVLVAGLERGGRVAAMLGVRELT